MKTTWQINNLALAPKIIHLFDYYDGRALSFYTGFTIGILCLLNMLLGLISNVR